MPRLRYMNLNEEMSEKYVTQPYFTPFITTRVQNVSKQVSLRLTVGPMKLYQYLPRLNEVHQVHLTLRNMDLPDMRTVNRIHNLLSLRVFLSRGSRWTPAAFGPIASLQELELHVPTLRWLPEFGAKLSQLRNLRKLTLSATEAGYGYEFLSNIPHLQELKISGSFHLESLPFMPQLEKLDISGISRISYRLADRVPNLRHLNISGANLTSLDVVSSLIEIESLDISHNAIADLFVLTNFPRLRDLNASFNPALTVLPPLPSLNVLDISSTHVADISVLVFATDLKKLNITETSDVTDISPVYTLNKLEHLQLGPLPDHRALIPLIGLENLKSLVSEGKTLGRNHAEVHAALDALL